MPDTTITGADLLQACEDTQGVLMSAATLVNLAIGELPETKDEQAVSLLLGVEALIEKTERDLRAVIEKAFKSA